MRHSGTFLTAGLLFLLIASMLAGCSSAPTPSPAKQSSALAATPTQVVSDVNKVKEAAIKEGSLNWIDAILVAENAQIMSAAFKKYYGLPDSFKVNFERLGTGPLASRVTEEVKAGKVTVDIFAVADPALFYDLKKANVLMQYESPEYKNFSKARAAGLTYEPGYWQSAIAYCWSPITNPKVYPKKITSWNDLLAPDLKGKKIEWPTPASSQSALYTYIGLRSIMGENYFVELAKQELTVGTNSVEQTQKLSQGETIVTITNPFRIVQTAAQTGVNLAAHFPKEGVILLGHPYGILTQSPHPNAAKLFIDWLYGEQGMKMYVELEAVIAIRDGAVVPDSIKSYSPPLSDLKTVPVDWKSLDTATLDKYRQEATKVLGK